MDNELDAAQVLNTAYAAFPQVFGAKLKQQREAVQSMMTAVAADPMAFLEQMQEAGLEMPDGLDEMKIPSADELAGANSLEALSEMLLSTGLVVSPQELAQLESGTYSNIDVRLMLGLAFLLEFSVDEVLMECLQKGVG